MSLSLSLTLSFEHLNSTKVQYSTILLVEDHRLYDTMGTHVLIRSAGHGARLSIIVGCVFIAIRYMWRSFFLGMRVWRTPPSKNMSLVMHIASCHAASLHSSDMHNCNTLCTYLLIVYLSYIRYASKKTLYTAVFSRREKNSGLTVLLPSFDRPFTSA